jgi:hypothetical protein
MSVTDKSDKLVAASFAAALEAHQLVREVRGDRARGDGAACPEYQVEQAAQHYGRGPRRGKLREVVLACSCPLERQCQVVLGVHNVR